MYFLERHPLCFVLTEAAVSEAYKVIAFRYKTLWNWHL